MYGIEAYCFLIIRRSLTCLYKSQRLTDGVFLVHDTENTFRRVYVKYVSLFDELQTPLICVHVPTQVVTYITLIVLPETLAFLTNIRVSPMLSVLGILFRTI